MSKIDQISELEQLARQQLEVEGIYRVTLRHDYIYDSERNLVIRVDKHVPQQSRILVGRSNPLKNPNEFSLYVSGTVRGVIRVPYSAVLLARRIGE